MSYIDYETLSLEHEAGRARDLFEQFKKTPPTYEISPAFAHQLIASLPDGMAKFDHAEFGLENPDSDTRLEWCEHFYLNLPSIEAKVLIEVGDGHYFVNILLAENEWWEGETFRHWESVTEYIEEAVAMIFDHN